MHFSTGNWECFSRSENCCQPWPIREHEITFIFKRETVLSIHQWERVNFKLKTTCLVSICRESPISNHSWTFVCHHLLTTHEWVYTMVLLSIIPGLKLCEYQLSARTVFTWFFNKAYHQKIYIYVPVVLNSKLSRSATQFHIIVFGTIQTWNSAFPFYFSIKHKRDGNLPTVCRSVLQMHISLAFPGP